MKLEFEKNSSFAQVLLKVMEPRKAQERGMGMRETISLQDVRELRGTDVTSGAVFLVEVFPYFNAQKSCQWFNVILTANEGEGQRYLHTLVNNHETSIPVQVELWLMEIECLPTWSWYWDGSCYNGQFANKKNYKCSEHFSAERQPSIFKVVL